MDSPAVVIGIMPSASPPAVVHMPRMSSPSLMSTLIRERNRIPLPVIRMPAIAGHRAPNGS